MQKFLRAILISLTIICLLLLGRAELVRAADPGSCTVSYASVNSEVSTITWTWIASADNGAVPSTASGSLTGWIFMATTNPGTPAPQDDYDIVLSDSDSADVFSGLLNNRDTANSEHAVPLTGTAYYGPRFVNGALTMTLTNNNVNSAKGTLTIYYYRSH